MFFHIYHYEASCSDCKGLWACAAMHLGFLSWIATTSTINPKLLGLASLSQAYCKIQI